jgi:hypothetical protein
VTGSESGASDESKEGNGKEAEKKTTTLKFMEMEQQQQQQQQQAKEAIGSKKMATSDPMNPQVCVFNTRLLGFIEKIIIKLKGRTEK